jgi:hypothetical protein
MVTLRRVRDLAHVCSLTGLGLRSDSEQLLTGGNVDGFVRRTERMRLSSFPHRQLSVILPAISTFNSD